MTDANKRVRATPPRNDALTEHSPPGLYIVITASGTLYRVEITSHDRPVSVMRFPIVESLLRDGTWLPSVTGFRFDADTGVGEIRWWKDDPADYDRPDRPYSGTTRTTTRVQIIARIDTGVGMPFASGGETPDTRSTARDVVIDLLRQTLAGLATHEQLAVFVEMLLDTRDPERRDEGGRDHWAPG